MTVVISTALCLKYSSGACFVSCIVDHHTRTQYTLPSSKLLNAILFYVHTCICAYWHMYVQPYTCTCVLVHCRIIDMYMYMYRYMQLARYRLHEKFKSDIQYFALGKIQSCSDLHVHVIHALICYTCTVYMYMYIIKILMADYSLLYSFL